MLFIVFLFCGKILLVTYYYLVNFQGKRYFSRDFILLKKCEGAWENGSLDQKSNYSGETFKVGVPS